MSFQYTSGDPTHLVGGTAASMADISGPFADLKTFVNARLAAVPTVVSSLPGGPVDGQEIYYLADGAGTQGGPVYWHLRYVSASSKWYFIGGAPLFKRVDTEETVGLALNTWGEIATTGPDVTVPLTGDYYCDSGAMLQGGIAGQIVKAGIAKGVGATPARAIEQAQSGTSALARNNMMMSELITGVTASTVLRMRYRAEAASGGTPAAGQRWLAVTPWRIG